ncbi:hypothetical protein [Lysinibacter sp. HNR]|uniref:hypothetical protein n=1 Tax=Lysinibacter sp. HNR TaxID=3031408 RepID=UPI0024357CAC|nr:hypothetical protein [Lysinibacter sp. HNR]WGD38503.1 hypothetical protein FrondiHNR_06220 [Lysinibacter sp. HNR]
MTTEALGDYAWAVLGVASTVSAIVASFITVLVTLWLRKRDRPEPDWIFTSLEIHKNTALQQHLASHHERKDPDLMLIFTNAGDGQAFQLSLEGIGCDTELFIPDNTDVRGFRFSMTLARVQPQEDFSVFIWFHPLHTKDQIGVKLRWLLPPTRHGHYVEKLILLHDPAGKEHLTRQVPHRFSHLLRLFSSFRVKTRHTK